MKIPVIFASGAVGTILIQDLDDLLQKKIVVGFCRSSGWAVISRDELRSDRVDKNGSWRDRKHKRLQLTM